MIDLARATLEIGQNVPPRERIVRVVTRVDAKRDLRHVKPAIVHRWVHTPRQVVPEQRERIVLRA